ncbi:MAG: phosphomevalonate kinase [Deltaproteobacteria bacterium]|nr:phosphomevalonate kinase [Deltaproteobacteria bacterium]
MAARALSAAGKLFLAGEYAVLWGGTARVACVGPRTHAWVRPREDRHVALHLAEGTLRGTCTPLGVAWDGEVAPPFLFAARTVDLALRAYGGEGPGFALALSPSPLGPGGRKLGLGSSARATVLVAEACRAVLEAGFDARVLALLSHSVAQGGKGSGGDVAASALGGVVRYRRYPLEGLQAHLVDGRLGTALASAPPLEARSLSSVQVRMLYAFAGDSASTPVLIRRAEATLDADARAAFVRESDALGHALEDALCAGDFAQLAPAVEGLQRLLCTLGPLETDAMARILALARAHGCMGKMSGAGGGDGCVLFAPGDAEAAALVDTLAARGFHAFPLTLEEGVRGEGAPPESLRAWARD